MKIRGKPLRNSRISSALGLCRVAPFLQLCASVEPQHLATLGLVVGDPVRAQFAASQVLLGTQL